MTPYATAAPISSARWPGGARCVVCVTVHMDGPAVEAGKGLNHLGIHSRGRYAACRGVPRTLDVLTRHGIPATYFMCGYDAELYPALMRDVHAAGHEIAAHGYRHEGWELGDEKAGLLERTHAILSDCVGEGALVAAVDALGSPAAERAARKAVPSVQGEDDRAGSRLNAPGLEPDPTRGGQQARK